MKLDETKKILKKVKTAYSYVYEKKTNDELQDILDLWNEQLKDYSYESIDKALDFWIKTNTFAPKIADLIYKRQSNFAQRQYDDLETYYDVGGNK